MRVSSVLASILVFGVLVSVRPSVGATVVFQDDFEGYAAGSTWPAGPNANPGAPPVGDAWVVAEPTAAYAIQVLNIPQTNSGPSFSSGPHGGANFLATTFGALGNHASAPLSAASQALVATNANLTLDMWVFKNSLDGYTGSPRIVAYDSPAGNTTGGVAFDLRFNDNGTVANDLGVITGLTPSIETWNHLTVLANFGNHTYDVTVGAQTVTGLPFVTNTISTIQHVRLFGVNPDARGAFDDILITTTAVPEPGSFAIIFTGMIAPLAGALRKRRQ